MLRYKDSVGSSNSPFNRHLRQLEQRVGADAGVVDVQNTDNDGVLPEEVQHRGGHVAMDGSEEVELTMCFVSTENGGSLIDHVSIFS